MSNQDFCNENKHHLGSWSTNGAGRVRRDRALPSACIGVACGLGDGLQREGNSESQGGLEKWDLFICPTAEEGGRWLSYSSGSQLEDGEGQRRAAEKLMDKFVWGLGHADV